MFKNTSLKLSTIMLGAALLSACGATNNNAETNTALTEAVASRTAEAQSRDMYRNPAETLSFFKVEPGMKVAEVLPGGGWYSNVLARYLGSEGELYGVNYVDSMWPRFGFFDEEGVKSRIALTHKFSENVQGFTDNGIKTGGYTFETLPQELNGKLDRVLFIRALHNLNRFEKDAETLTQALTAAHRVLKKDGYVGVVQHKAPDSAAEATVDGSRGYLKQKDVIAFFEKAGFEFVASSDINNNPKDVPSDSDIVWRLPPVYVGTRDDEEKKAAVDAIGESNRMTLLFKKAS